MKVSVSIVTYNSIDDIDSCLASFSKLEGTDFVLYVVDNASSDGTAEHVESAYPWVRLIRSERNVGFGAAHNMVIKQIDSDCHIIVNPDITLDASQIPLMAKCLEENPDIVLITPKVLNPDGTMQYLPKRRPTVRYLMSGFLEKRSERFRRIREEYTMKDVLGDVNVDVDFCTGCFMFVRTSALKECGGFDERYFLHFEDADLTRMLQRICRTVYMPCFTVTHAWHRDNSRLGKVFFISIESMFRYFMKWR